MVLTCGPVGKVLENYYFQLKEEMLSAYQQIKSLSGQLRRREKQQQQQLLARRQQQKNSLSAATSTTDGSSSQAAAEDQEDPEGEEEEDEHSSHSSVGKDYLGFNMDGKRFLTCSVHAMK